MIGLPVLGDVGLVFPEASGETGKAGGTEGGGFVDLRTHDGDAEDIGLHLHEEVVERGTAIDAEFLQFDAGIGLHGLEDVGHLERDGFEGGTGDVGAGGAASDANEDAASIGVPMRGTETGEGVGFVPKPQSLAVRPSARRCRYGSTPNPRILAALQ